MLEMVNIYFRVLITQAKNHNTVLLGLYCTYNYIIKYMAKLSEWKEADKWNYKKKQATKYSVFKIKVLSDK